MRLTNIGIKNLRSIADTGDFEVHRLFALVGENNTGKSNVLRSIEIFLTAGSAKLTRADFHDDSKQIIIKGTFTDLTAKEKVQWRPYLIGDSLALEKHVSVSIDERTNRDKVESEYHGYRAEPKDWFLSITKIQEKLGDRPKWNDLIKDAGLPDYFADEGKANKTTYTKGLARYLIENDVAFDEPDLSSTQALGLQSNVTANLPRVYLLSAITNYQDEIDKRSSTSTSGV